MSNRRIPVGISNRHLHLSQEDLETLFGKGYELTVLKDLSQTGQYAAEETVTLVGPKGVIQRVRVLGPTRSQTQVEISLTDSFALGVKPPVRDSGDVENSPGIAIVGPVGCVQLEKGVIIAKRHIHMTSAEAAEFGVQDKDIVKVAVTEGDRALVFDQVLVRVRDDFVLELHLDTDEANAAGLRNGQLVELIK
ncbi:MAG: phosphate propanoyltransferase [Limnochordia bacterium]|jgi:putative phosphotransacetylase